MTRARQAPQHTPAVRVGQVLRTRLTGAPFKVTAVDVWVRWGDGARTGPLVAAHHLRDRHHTMAAPAEYFALPGQQLALFDEGAA